LTGRGAEEAVAAPDVARAAAIARLSAWLLELVEPAAPDDDALLTPQQVAARLHVSRKWVYANQRELGARHLVVPIPLLADPSAACARGFLTVS